jgi:hypothetical protein
MVIYPTCRKSWSPDLHTDSGTEFAVKTQEVTESRKYGTSWVFEKSDTVIKRPDTIAVFVQLDNSSNSGEIKAITSIGYLVDRGMFQDTKLYLPTKCAVYLDSLNK